ncbi:MAG TPA: hypothetical protein VN461_02160 [Vicinamibacteria bacterium]|nr:hypothetical protein [Vicinamibacteria bacterium]
MMFEHLRARRRLPLLAAGVLDGPARGATLAHVASCSSCRGELDELGAVLRLLASDLKPAEPPLSLSLLVARVGSRLDELDRGPGTVRPRPWVVASWAGAAAVVAAVAAVVFLLPGRPRGGNERPLVSEDTLQRLERNVAREQAARYLGEAQDVLVSVAAAPPPCDREKVDMGEASERSRKLLTRGALLVDPEGPAVASARPVLNDVEQALRQVAALESCVRARDVQRVREDLARRQLLMKIRLMKRELEG